MSTITHIHEAVRAILADDADVLALCPAERIRPWHLWRTDQRPAITYQHASRTSTYSYDGPDDWKQTRLQLNCHGRTYDETWSLARAVDAALDGVHRDDRGAVRVHRIRVDDADDLPADPPPGREQPLFAVRLDLIIAHEAIEAAA